MRAPAARFVSRLTNNTIALILAGGRGERLGSLTEWRTKPAVPFAGRFRIIDFSLSNCVHSGINKVCVLTQYKSHSLIRHLIQGWTKLNSERGDFLDVIPAQQWTDDETWYQGTADAVHQSLDIIESHQPDYVIILAGDHVYHMDYGEMLAEHVNMGADFSIACLRVPVNVAAGQLGVLEIDENNRVQSFDEKPEKPKTLLGDAGHVFASMGIYVISRRYLSKRLREDAQLQDSSHDFGKDIIPSGIKSGDYFHAHKFQNPYDDGDPYWRDVGTVDSFFSANMELLSADPPLDLYNGSWPTLTNQPQLPPASFTGTKGCTDIRESMVSGGCVVSDSKLKHSLLFSSVWVEQGCRLNRVLALPGCRIGAGSRISNAILDNRCNIPAGTVIGEDPVADSEKFNLTEGKVVVVNRTMLGQHRSYMPGVQLPTARFD